jgi:hypothetical protein
MEVLKVKISEIKPNPKNPRLIKDEKFKKLVKSIKDFPQMLELRPIVVDENNIILGGNMRFKALKEAGYTEVSIVRANDLTSEQKDEFIVKDNVGFGEWDWDSLANEWEVDKLEEWGLDLPVDLSVQEEDKEVIAHEKLQEKFIIPPFSILDTRQGYWIERKKNWKNLIQDFGESRENTLHNSNSSEKSVMNEMPSVSILDPVLAEITNKWFGLEKCNTFDCFAGDTVFGYVSSYLGNKFTGIELRKEQAELNNLRVKGFNANYICDDGRNVLNYIEENSQDLLFSCPPYFDLEVYSDLENDASNQETYEEFIEIIEDAFSKAIKCLKENRFAVITVGDVRDKDGYYYNFIEDIKRIFIKNGMKLYNELILIESLGTLPQRVGRFMKQRKVGKCHQNVLVFYKGNTKEIKNIFPSIEIE